MRSDSLMRFDSERVQKNQRDRLEIEQQTREFLGRGGKIECLPGFGERRERPTLSDGRIPSRA